MEKDKFPNHGEGSLPPSGRYLGFSIPGNSLNTKSELLSSSSSTMPPLGPWVSSESIHFGHGMPLDSSHFSHDISRMPDNPPKKMGHRRAQSEILTLPDDISFGGDLGHVVGGGLGGPSLSDETEEDLFSMYIDIDKFNSSNLSSSLEAQALAPTPAENVAPASSERQRVRHLHCQSMDGSTTIKPEMLISGRGETSAAVTRKAMSAAKLAELALIDPKRAKRIWANRQSAARSKERKMRYIAELERKVQTLQTDATSLSAQLILMQRDTNDVTAENSELKIRLQTIEQQFHQQDELNDTMKEEIQHLKILIGQAVLDGRPSMNFASSFGTNQRFYSNNHAMSSLSTAQQFQHLQIHSQMQQQQHQFQPHQLQQFQQQQQPEQHPQLTEDMKMGGSMPSSSQE